MNNEPLTLLVADNEPSTHTIFDALSKKHPHLKIVHAFSSQEAIEQVSKDHIDMAFIDLYLHPIHGLELLKKIKSSLPQAEVVLFSYEPMVQNYRASLSHGALDFLPKPLKIEALEAILKKRASGSYEPFPPPQYDLSQKPFDLQARSSDSFIKFWGTRGSHSVSGTDFIRYGGNTSCLEIKSGNDLVIIDAGTGLSNLGKLVMNEYPIHTLNLLLGHTHLDHMAGLPSFSPLHDERFQITIRAPINFFKSTKELLRDMFTHAFFPVDLEEIKAALKFKELLANTPFEIGSIKIDCHYTYHPGTTLCFKITVGSTTIGYITDNEVLMGYTQDPRDITLDHPLLKPHLDFIEFFKNTDILIHEAQYSSKEYAKKIGWGHSSIYNACALIKFIQPKTWIITHHDPEATDEMIQRKYEMIQDACHYLNFKTIIRMAYDGLKINL